MAISRNYPSYELTKKVAMVSCSPSFLVAASQKHTTFALKNGNSIFHEANLETLFGRDVCNE
jgi:hypothetical protein